MTLVLSHSIRVPRTPGSKEVEIKSHPASTSPDYLGKGEAVIRIGDCYVSMTDFCEAVRYVLTSTDLEDRDPRRKLVQDIRESTYQVLGYNAGAARYHVDPT